MEGMVWHGLASCVQHGMLRYVVLGRIAAVRGGNRKDKGRCIACP